MANLNITSLKILEKIRQLYEQSPLSKADLYLGENKKRLEDMLNGLAEIELDTLEIEKLDKLSIGDKRYLSSVLAYLPPEALSNEFGEDVLIWTWFNSKRNNLLEPIHKLTGKNPEYLKRLCFDNYDMLFTNIYRDAPYKPVDTLTIKAAYKLVEKFGNGDIGNVDLASLLRECQKEGVEFSDRRVKDYRLKALVSEEDNLWSYAEGWTGKIIGNKTFSIFLDAPVGVTLLYKERPNAAASFIPTEPKTLMVRQLQGIRPHKVKNPNEKCGHSRGLMPLDWQRFFVGYIKNLAKELDFEVIAIQSAKNNEWVNQGTINYGNALTRYDALAERLGFKQRKDKNWYLTL